MRNGQGCPLKEGNSMKKHIFLLSLLLSFVVATTSCTSKKVDKDAAEDSELAEDIASEEAGESAEEKPAESGSEISDLEDDLNSDSSEEQPAETAQAGEQPATDDLDGLSADAPAEGSGEETSAATDDTAAPTDASAETPADTASEAPTEDMAAMSGSTDETQGLTEEPVPAPVVPLQKMATTPYTKNGILVNAIYVAREGDTTESVSQKIFGQDKSEELKTINPTLARRAMKVGDKIYYNSPQRSSDNTEIKTYYEDMGLAPEVYLSQSGDNIRTVAKTLLGHSDSWKEIWSTNLDVESKAELSEGTRLRYWSSPTTSMPPVAAATVAPTPTEMAPPSTAQTPDMAAQGQTQPYDASMDTPPPAAGEAEMVPPPPPVQAAEESPVPPPPPAEMTPPPQDASAATMDEAMNLEDPDQMMALGAGAILLFAAIALFIIIRKKRSRRANIDFQTASHTNID